jgi:benzodiazapine receptor
MLTHISVTLILVASFNLSIGYENSVRSSFNLQNVIKKQGIVEFESFHTTRNPRVSPLTAKWNPHMSVASTSNPSVKTPDYLAVLNYIGATSVQWTLIATFLHFFQICIISKLKDLAIKVPSTIPAKLLEVLPSLPSALVGIFMLFMSLKSRVFSPLDNSRPSASKDDPVFRDRLRPSWTPPPLAFPIIWSSIALLRTFSTVFIFQKTGTLLCSPIFALMGHLSIGDTWNTINNVEKRLGTAVLGVSFVWASALYATYLYYKTLPLAGKVLFPSCVWLTVASFLVFSIWRMNSIYLNDRPSLFPSKEEGPRSTWRLPFTTPKK